MDQDDLFSHPVDALGDSVVPDLDLEPVALLFPGNIFCQRAGPLPEHLLGFASSANPERLKFLFEIMETEIEQVPFILLPLQVVVAEPRNRFIPDLQGDRFDEDRVRLVFLEVLGAIEVLLGGGEHLLHRLEGREAGMTNDNCSSTSSSRLPWLKKLRSRTRVYSLMPSDRTRWRVFFRVTTSTMLPG